MNPYEGMIIFPEAMNEETLDEAIGKVKTEIERMGGRIDSTTRLGKRSFARPMKKEKVGHYVVFGFDLDGAKIDPLHKRFKLMPEVFRVQMLRAKPAAASDEQGADAPPEKEQGDGVS